MGPAREWIGREPGPLWWPWGARDREGAIALVLPDSSGVTGYYRMSWGNFVGVVEVPEPGTGPRLSSLTCVGAIGWAGPARVRGEFEVTGLRFGRWIETGILEDSRAVERSLRFSTRLRGLPGHQVTVEMIERRRIIHFDRMSSRYGNSRTVNGFAPTERLVRLRVERLDPDGGWIPLGQAEMPG